MTDVLLPTSEPDYDFLFSARIRWCPVDGTPELPTAGQSGLAVSAVLARAREISAMHPPNRASLTQHELAGALSTMQPGPTDHVVAMATDVTLRLSEADATRLERLATVRKEKEVWAHEREYECDRREYLGKDVLKDTGTALVWWLTKHEDQLKQAVEEIGPLAQLSSAANNRDIPEQFVHMAPHPKPVPETDVAPPGARGEGSTGFEGATSAPAAPRAPEECFGALLDSMRVPQSHGDSGVLARYFSEAAAELGYKDAADALRDRFDLFSRGYGESDEDDHSADEGDSSAPPWE